MILESGPRFADICWAMVYFDCRDQYMSPIHHVKVFETSRFIVIIVLLNQSIKKQLTNHMTNCGSQLQIVSISAHCVRKLSFLMKEAWK